MSPLDEAHLATVFGGHHALVAGRGVAAWYGNAFKTVLQMALEPGSAPAHALAGYARGVQIAGKTVYRLATEGHPDGEDFVRATKYELGQIAKGKPF